MTAAAAMRSMLASVTLLTTAIAQLPTDAIVVLETTSNLVDPNYKLVDALGRGYSTVRGQNVFMQPSPVSVATDPTWPSHFFFQANPSSLAGTWRCDVGAVARITLSTWGPWLRTSGDRVEVGSSRVFTLRGGLVDACIKSSTAQQTPANLFTLGNAVDLAVQEPFLFVASYQASSPAPLIEYDLGTATQRTVGNYIGVKAIAVSPIAAEILLGTAAGELTTIDPATGAVINTVNTGIGPIVAVGYTRFGTRVFASATQLWSELQPAAPIYISATTIADFGVTRALTASVATYGRGCGLGTAASWSALGLPTLGNASFQLGLLDAPASTIAALALGASRSYAAQLAVSLPYDLGLFGAPGCDLLVDPLVSLVLTTNGAGDANQTVPIPNAPSLAGSEFVAQWFVSDGSVGSLGIAVTEGVVFVVR